MPLRRHADRGMIGVHHEAGRCVQYPHLDADAFGRILRNPIAKRGDDFFGILARNQAEAYLRGSRRGDHVSSLPLP